MAKNKTKPFYIVGEIKKILEDKNLDGTHKNDMGVLISRLADEFGKHGYNQVSTGLKEVSENYIYVSYAGKDK